MVEKRETHVGTATERNAFPVGKSIVAGIVSLLAIRYVFGLFPLAYPIDGEHVDFYYKGHVVRVPAPTGYCFTGRSDWIENALQAQNRLIRWDDEFSFVTFRSFQSCEAVFSETFRNHTYTRYLSPWYYFHDEAGRQTPGKIGIAGIGAELLPVSESGEREWLDSEPVQRRMETERWASAVLTYFPGFDGYDESFRVVTQSTNDFGNGYCNVAFGVFLELDYSQHEDLLDGLKEQYEARRTNFENLLGSEVLEERGAVYLARYLVPFAGRAVYYSIAEEIGIEDALSGRASLSEWGHGSCSAARSAADNSLSSAGADRRLFGISRRDSSRLVPELEGEWEAVKP